jgi:hypothetical protein
LGLLGIEHDIRGFIDKTSLNFISFVLRLLKNNKNYILNLNNFLTWYKNFINKKVINLYFTTLFYLIKLNIKHNTIKNLCKFQIKKNILKYNINYILKSHIPT